MSACLLRAASLALVGFMVGGVGGQAIAAPTSLTTAPSSSPPKTVTWYANNRQERARVQLACIDDPGHLLNNPDCVNAHQASVDVAIREGKQHNGELNPNKLQYWSDDPVGRRDQLILCRLNPRQDHCDLARRSLLIEAGRR